mgnify:CR=1 FL=1
MATESTLLRVLLRQRHMQGYRTFCKEYDRAAKQLAGCHRERRVPEDIVKARFNPPGSQRVEQNAAWISGLVRMVLVPQLMTFVGRVEKLG